MATDSSSTSTGRLSDLPDTINFPQEEEKILKFWDEIDAFQESLRQSAGRPLYSFYDGPPFATGLPHYGHILAGTIKDIVTRYAHQSGFHVERRFGWDCHGVPIEFEIEQQLGIKTREQVLEMGIDKYNAACRGIVMKFSSEWRRVVTRMGRWIDFDRDYKTMDLSFMESVWWVFKRLFDLGLVYEGFKVMPYSTGCSTSLSNFEANLNYKDVSDPAIVITFPLVDEPDVSLLAWTTTPWTLPSNLATCVHPDFDYVTVEDEKTKHKYLLAESRLVAIYKKDPKKGYKVLKRCKGIELKGLAYTPLFGCFAGRPNAFRILVDTFVTSDSGTGVVHCAPGFGEDDYRICMEAGVITARDIPCPIDHAGRFTAEVADYQGRYVKDCDREIMQRLKAEGRLIDSGTIVHSYPFCWRSETPLLYRAVPSWFVAVEKIRDRIVANNTLTHWVPDFVKEKRFHNWLVNARDWAVSRNRFWGTPLPIWSTEDGLERICIGSIEELETLSGVKVVDLHRESVDHITIPSQRGPEFGVLRRIDSVFDCWFESGSMPYAQKHYPFENESEFTHSFPADFIAEGLDQTRGWFYTLLVLSTALFDKPPFKHVIVNGLVLAEDGKKMSKRLKNYADPSEVVSRHGADALRLYLINSPVVRAEPLRFKEQGVRDIIKDVFLPWFNAFRFMMQNVVRLDRKRAATAGPFTPLPDSVLAASTNVTDRWIRAATHSLIQFVRQEMAAYRLYTVIPRLLAFINDLTNWYVRMNRTRMKQGDDESVQALSQLFSVLVTVAKTMAPFTPFLTEYMYQYLKRIAPELLPEQSVHFSMVPEYDENALDPAIERRMKRMQSVIETGRLARDRRRLGLKLPLKRIVCVSQNEEYIADVLSLDSYIKEELNIATVDIDREESRYVLYRADVDYKRLGPRCGREMKTVVDRVKAMTAAEIQSFTATGSFTVGAYVLDQDDIRVVRECLPIPEVFEAAQDDESLLLLDTTVDAELREKGLAREIVNRIQKLRKRAQLSVEDVVDIYYSVNTSNWITEALSHHHDDAKTGTEYDDLDISAVINRHGAFLRSLVRVSVLPVSQMPASAINVVESDERIGSHSLRVVIARTTVGFPADLVDRLCADGVTEDAESAEAIRQVLLNQDYLTLMAQVTKTGGSFTANVYGKNVQVKLNRHFYPTVADALASSQ